MKTLFLCLFLLILVVLGAATALLLGEFGPKAQLDEKLRDRALDTLEQALTAAPRTRIFDAIETKIEEKLGLCRLMTRPSIGPANAMPPITPIPGARVPFSQPFILEDASLLCSFPFAGKSILLIPINPVSLTIRRYPNQPGLFTYRSGTLVIFSDALNISLDLPDMSVSLKAKMPSNLVFAELDSRLQVLLIKTKLDVTFKPRLQAPGAIALQAPSVVQFNIPEGSSVTSEDKVMSTRESVELLPSGLRVLPHTWNSPPANPNATPSNTANATATTTTTAPAPTPKSAATPAH